MNDPDRDKAKTAWARASDPEVVRGLIDIGEYPPAIREIIQSEAGRRNLSIDSVFPETYPALQAPARAVKRLGAKFPRWIQRHPYGSAAVLGLVYRLLASTVSLWIPIWVALIAYFLLLIWICLPQRRYLVIIGAAFTAAIANCAFTAMLVAYQSWSPDPGYRDFLMRWLFYTAIGTLGILGGGGSVLLCAINYVRNRYWPLIIPGRCRVCDYDLRGLPEPRCPECGTPFDPAEAIGALDETTTKK